MLVVSSQLLYTCVCVGLAAQARLTTGSGPGMFPRERTGGGFACLYTEKDDAYQKPKGLTNELSNRN